MLIRNRPQLFSMEQVTFFMSCCPEFGGVIQDIVYLMNRSKYLAKTRSTVKKNIFLLFGNAPIESYSSPFCTAGSADRVQSKISRHCCCRNMDTGTALFYSFLTCLADRKRLLSIEESCNLCYKICLVNRKGGGHF